MNPSSHYLRCEGRELHYTEWGSEHRECVIAWHGLARTGRDMDDIAAHLAQRWRVICPDTLGRGLSQWSPAPDDEYHLGFYAAQAVDLLDQLVAMYRAGAERSGWRCFATCGGEMIPPGRAIFGLGGAVSALRHSAPTRSDEGPYR